MKSGGRVVIFWQAAVNGFTKTNHFWDAQCFKLNVTSNDHVFFGSHVSSGCVRSPYRGSSNAMVAPWLGVLSYQILVQIVCMLRRLSLQPHHTFETLEGRYRAANDPVACSHWQVIWLLARGIASAQIAAVTG